MEYVMTLRNLKTGWTLEQRKHYFDWFNSAQPGMATVGSKGKRPARMPAVPAQGRHPVQLLEWFKEAGREYSDGASYNKYLANIRKDAIDALPEADRVALSSWTEDYAGLAAFKPAREMHFVKEWKMADLEPALPQVGQGRNFASGKAAYHDAQCILCHRFGNEGGSVGPELTAASSKYSRRDILESILEPSKVISEQFQNITIIKKDGDDVSGRLVDEDGKRIVIQPSPLNPERVEIKKGDIAERRVSKVSPMPEGLANQLTENEILDLLAYIESAGKEKAANFKTEREVSSGK